MTAYELHKETIHPFSNKDKPTMARTRINEVALDTAEIDILSQDSAFDRLKRLLPQIECISFTDQELAEVTLMGSNA